MVLRKPYAFLIKHFRIIHAIIAALILYLLATTTNIVSFFHDYVTNGYFSYSANLAGTYVNLLMYGALVLILTSTIAIYLLFRNKNKSRALYLASIIYYVILFVGLILIYSVFRTLETGSLEASTARVYRDLSLIIYLPQFFFLFYMAFRAIGFDIKKFNFAKDLEELEIDAKDNEEFEFAIGFETYKVKRTLRRAWREGIYYVKENAFILSCIGGALGGIFLISLIFSIQINNKKYRENETFAYSAFNLRVRDSILTAYDYKGNTIQEGKYYLALQIRVQNRTEEATTIDTQKFRLLVNKEIVYPTLDRGSYFIDLGEPYANNKIAAGATKDYVIAYELTQEQLRDAYTLQVVDNYIFNIGSITPRYKETKLKPTKIDKVKKEGPYQLEEEIDIDALTLENSKLAIDKYKITDAYKYQYEFCYNDKCHPSTGVVSVDYQTSGARATLIALQYKLEIDDDNTYQIQNNKNFFLDYATLKYTIDGETKRVGVKDKTPREFKDIVILQTSQEIANADSLSLVLTIRDTQYEIILKEENTKEEE